MAIELNTGPDLPSKTDYRIGCVGAGFIMKDIHLVAYAEAGFDVVAIASRTPANAQAVASERGVATVHDTWEELLDDERVEIVDIAFPPDQQLAIVREAVKRPHVKGILAQKPVAFTLDEAVEMVRVCDEAASSWASTTTCGTTSRCGRSGRFSTAACSASRSSVRS